MQCCGLRGALFSVLLLMLSIRHGRSSYSDTKKHFAIANALPVVGGGVKAVVAPFLS